MCLRLLCSAALVAAVARKGPRRMRPVRDHRVDPHALSAALIDQDVLLPESFEFRRGVLHKCASRWEAPPQAAELFRGSCGISSSWTAGGEPAYCDQLNSTELNACADVACGPFHTISGRHREWLSVLRSTSRDAALSHWLSKRADPGADVILMAANAGYLYFLENWIRHADKQGVDVRNNTLILTDENTAKVVKGLGFRPVSTKLYRADILFESSQDQQTASPIFAAAPSHSGTNAMALAALTDLLQLGVNVLWTDADTVINKDPLPWLSSAQPYATCADFEIEQRDGDLRERVSQHWPRVLCFNESASALMNATGAAWRSPDVQMMEYASPFARTSGTSRTAPHLPFTLSDPSSEQRFEVGQRRARQHRLRLLPKPLPHARLFACHPRLAAGAARLEQRPALPDADAARAGIQPEHLVRAAADLALHQRSEPSWAQERAVAAAARHARCERPGVPAPEVDRWARLVDGFAQGQAADAPQARRLALRLV
jgi:hypothetical protein